MSQSPFPAAKITHPNLCPIYDVSEIDGIHCIAMAYIKGRPLSEYIDKEKPPPEKVIATIVQKVALAMAEAHQNGILHRDLKPANI
ncbi:MAG: protein kinase, partial [Planctomycetota bacterium]